MNSDFSASSDLQALEQAAFDAKRRAEKIEKDKIIRQHEREQKRAEREDKRKRELLAKLVAPALLLATILLGLIIHFFSR